MPRSRTANRRKASFGKTTRKPVSKDCPKSQRFQGSSLEYDESATQFANYQRLGLLADANQIGAASGRITGFKPRVKGPMAAPSDGATHPLELEVPPALKTVRAVPLGERSVLLKLLEKHVDDYAAMARDMRINTLQHTAAHLRRRIAKMREEDTEEAAEAAEKAAAGEPPPPPNWKHRPKPTLDPNPAFKKRSKNFT